MEHVAGPFKKKFREYEQPWHIRKFDAVREEILELEPEILNDKPSNERVSCALLPHSPPDLLLHRHSRPISRGGAPLVTACYCAEQIFGPHCSGIGASVRGPAWSWGGASQQKHHDEAACEAFLRLFP